MTRLTFINRIAITIAAFLVISLLAGCSPLVQVEQPRIDAFLPLENDKTIGQTFTGRYDGLQGIAVYLRPESPGNGDLQMQLSTSPLGGEKITQVDLPLEKIDRKGFYRFNFPPVDGSAGDDFYLSIRQSGEGSVRAGIASAESYTGGAAYRNGAPEEAQLAFRLIYEPRRFIFGLAGEILKWLKLLTAAAFLYLLPGWGLLSLLYSSWGERRWPEKIGLAAGVSLTVYPLLYLWTSLVGLPLGALYAWIPPVLAAVYLTVKTIRGRRKARTELHEPDLDKPARHAQRLRSYLLNYGPVDLAYLALALLVLAARFWSVRTLDLPMWGDSYHHSLITQLLSDHGGLFDSWAPYAEMQTFTYHFGFHTLSATLGYLTGFDAATATLWAGQLMNVLAVFCLVPLAVRMGRNPWAGVVAVLLAGMLAPMPMAYTNWGRYTQLAGQVILAAMVFLAWEALDRKRTDWRLIALAGITLGGLSLTHLRVLIIAILFLVSYILLSIRSGRLWLLLKRGLAVCGIAGILFLPWLIHTYSGQIMAIFNSQITTPASQVPKSTDQASGTGDLFAYLPALIWLFLPVVVGCGLWRRERSVLQVAVWCWLVWIAGEPGWYGLPGTGAVTTFAVLIAAYIPASMFYGAAAGWGMQVLESPARGFHEGSLSKRYPYWPRLAEVLIAILVISAGFWVFGARQQDIQIDEHALVLRPDLRAAEWIRDNLPAESRFLVNADLAFSESTTVGTDAGWWLPLTAGRQTTIPPMNYSFEREPWPGYREWVNSLYQQIDELGIDNPQVVDELRRRGVTHVYIGQQQGGVSDFSTRSFDPAALLSSPSFTPVYHQDRVWIFEVLPR